MSLKQKWQHFIDFTGSLPSSVTRLGDVLDFGQVFKAFGNNKFAQISHILRQFLERCQIFNFSTEIIFGQLL